MADFQGRDELHRQSVSVQTAGSSCDCGCPSFRLNPDRDLLPASVDERVPVEAHGRDPDGHLVGVLLFTEDGYLANVEVFGSFLGFPANRTSRSAIGAIRTNAGPERCATHKTPSLQTKSDYSLEDRWPGGLKSAGSAVTPGVATIQTPPPAISQLS